MAWEQEKIELRNRHDFDMEEQRKDIENQLVVQSDMRQKQKLDSKIQSLREAHEQGQIKEKVMNDEILRLKLGISDRFSALKPKTPEEQVFQDFIDQRKEAEAIQADPQKRDVAALRSLSGTLNESEKKDVEAIIEEGDTNKIKRTLDILEARASAEEGPSFLKSLSPIGAFSEILRAKRLGRQAGIPEEKKRPRSPEFSPFRQSLGSFR